MTRADCCARSYYARWRDALFAWRWLLLGAPAFPGHPWTEREKIWHESRTIVPELKLRRDTCLKPRAWRPTRSLPPQSSKPARRSRRRSNESVRWTRRSRRLEGRSKLGETRPGAIG